MKNTIKKATPLVIILIVILLTYSYTYFPGNEQESITYTSIHYTPKIINYELNGELELQLSIIPIDFGDWMSVDYSHSLWSYFNISIINKSNQLKTLPIEDNYFDVFIYQNNVEIYNIRQGMTDYNEQQTITLVPHGFFSNPKYNGASEYVEFLQTLPEGSYEIECVFHLNSETIPIGHITLEISKENRLIMTS